MAQLTKLALTSISLLSLNLVVFTVGALETSAQSSSTYFSDVPPNYWAQPFIQGLAARNIVAGYPDGTFRPQQPVDRDEFAAIIRKAFDQPPVRQIKSGAVYKDIPANYWAVRPIEEAYQQGFMTGYPGGYFRPNQPVSRVEAIVALNKGLDLINNPAAVSVPTTAKEVPQQTQPKAAKRRIFLPLAITSLMQPLLIPQAQAAQTNIATPTTPATTKQQATNVSNPASVIVANNYADANKIPQYAVGSVAAATKRNIVVNYPKANVFNPNQAATRGEISALVYQTLVSQNKIQPIANNSPANKYIVETQTNNQNLQ
ncbi:S-layer homology domain-containing protein [Nostoc sp. FACHB-87]|uniref:S-layer homology domain-containing protein n=1 Tax=Nostocaceae TaxID=1162 RepID=UPI001685A521|nr:MULTISPECIES: S-layer homology domain-containing protein [Nostocaceae]MBD2458375.1 S-layer homology domain-containing protein [Nostoc sp. FACHB-87]MBD2479531.1 S-layer homology domain-containing protein [Anabaena sp. FACHB-83]